VEKARQSAPSVYEMESKKGRIENFKPRRKSRKVLLCGCSKHKKSGKKEIRSRSFPMWMASVAEGLE